MLTRVSSRHLIAPARHRWNQQRYHHFNLLATFRLAVRNIAGGHRTGTSLSPFASFQAATMAVLATERYFNDLRKDLGDANFDRLFALHPTTDELNAGSKAVARLRKFRFFTPSISSGINMGKRLINNVRQVARKRLNKIRWALFPNSNDLTIEDVSFRRRRSLNF